MTYPQLIFTITNGDSTKNISFSNPIVPADDDKVEAAGNKLANMYGDDWSYVGGKLITAQDVGTPS